MATRATNPLRLDMVAFAAEGAAITGQWPGAELRRLAQSQFMPHDVAPADVSFDAQGERRPVAGAEPEIWLRLRVHSSVWLACQRCLQPYRLPLAIDRRLRFVRDEAEAEALDSELEDDVLALARWLDLRTLAEDELLLALPIVPRHEGSCPQPLPMPQTAAEPIEAPRINPFAVLRALKPEPGGDGR